MYKVRHGALKSNPNIVIDDGGDEISSNSGLFLVDEFLFQKKFCDKVQSTVKFYDDRHFYKYSNTTLLCQIILQIIAGDHRDRDANAIQYDPASGHPW